MVPLLVAVAIALVLPLLTRGSYRRMLGVDWAWGSFLLAGLAIRTGVEVGAVPASRIADVGAALLVASTVLVAAFCARNVAVRGMAVVLVGVLANAAVIAANGSIPTAPSPERGESTGTAAPPDGIRHEQRPGDRLVVLGETIRLHAPVATTFSFGDLVIAFGLVNVAYGASRVPRRGARRGTGRPDRTGTHAAVRGTDAPAPDDVASPAGASAPARAPEPTAGPDDAGPAPSPEPARAPEPEPVPRREPAPPSPEAPRTPVLAGRAAHPAGRADRSIAGLVRASRVLPERATPSGGAPAPTPPVLRVRPVPGSPPQPAPLVRVLPRDPVSPGRST